MRRGSLSRHLPLPEHDRRGAPPDHLQLGDQRTQVRTHCAGGAVQREAGGDRPESTAGPDVQKLGLQHALRPDPRLQRVVRALEAFAAQDQDRKFNPARRLAASVRDGRLGPDCHRAQESIVGGDEGDAAQEREGAQVGAGHHHHRRHQGQVLVPAPGSLRESVRRLRVHPAKDAVRCGRWCCCGGGRLRRRRRRRGRRRRRRRRQTRQQQACTTSVPGRVVCACGLAGMRPGVLLSEGGRV
mmetsp:Transcript_62243/g.146757  ORF Transcript_62243/g.146757 Transcript_62243/m.146757 type:complete len:242 (+) Transcript_62243:580-1305(+)